MDRVYKVRHLWIQDCDSKKKVWANYSLGVVPRVLYVFQVECVWRLSQRCPIWWAIGVRKLLGTNWLNYTRIQPSHNQYMQSRTIDKAHQVKHASFPFSYVRHARVGSKDLTPRPKLGLKVLFQKRGQRPSSFDPNKPWSSEHTCYLATLSQQLSSLERKASPTRVTLQILLGLKQILLCFS